GRLEPMRSNRPNALIVLGIVAAAALAAVQWLPHSGWSPPAGRRADRAAQPPVPTNAAADELQAERAEFERRQGALEARGADSWGGADFAAASARAAESVGARDAGNFALARQRLSEASLLLDT